MSTILGIRSFRGCNRANAVQYRYGCYEMVRWRYARLAYILVSSILEQNRCIPTYSDSAASVSASRKTIGLDFGFYCFYLPTHENHSKREATHELTNQYLRCWSHAHVRRGEARYLDKRVIASKHVFRGVLWVSGFDIQARFVARFSLQML